MLLYIYAYTFFGLLIVLQKISVQFCLQFLLQTQMQHGIKEYTYLTLKRVATYLMEALHARFSI